METKNSKQIWDYFDDHIFYPDEVAHKILPYGVIWSYISSTFLNGMVNYVKPISYFILDRYTNADKNIDRDFIVFNKSKHSDKLYKWKGTKKQLIEAIITNKTEIYDDISCFDDDVILIAEIETNEKDDRGRYMFFWFDCDVSDCSIGKFETTDTKEEVVQSVRNWLNECKEANKDKMIKDECDDGIINYFEILGSFLTGWIKF